jgi:starvation-inducible outer membrane lipoprotein
MEVVMLARFVLFLLALALASCTTVNLQVGGENALQEDQSGEVDLNVPQPAKKVRL